MIDEDPDDLEPMLDNTSGRDSTPRPRHRETPQVFEARLEDMTRKLHGPPKSHITDEQIETLVAGISAAVTTAVMENVRKETRDEVRSLMSENLKQLAFLSAKVLS